MNETINLQPRQKAVITLLAQYPVLTREQIADKIAAIYPVSKATLARDLADLLEKGYIDAIGQGPSSAYTAKSIHPLLKYIDLQQYFVLEPDQRTYALTSFNLEIFTQLHDLLTADEQTELKINFRSFIQSTTRIDPTIFQRELERFVVELSWKSSKIEGNTYSLLETERLIKESQEASDHPKHEAVMILNHKTAFDKIVQNRLEFKQLSFSTVVELHNLLTKDLSIQSGIRKHSVGITGTIYRPLDNEWQIKEALEKLIVLVNKTKSPLEKALILVSMMAYLQPFADGNKRTARMLANAVLMADDYFPLSYRSVDENEYKSALILFYETNNLFHVKRIFLEQYRFALKTYFV